MSTDTLERPVHLDTADSGFDHFVCPCNKTFALCGTVIPLEEYHGSSAGCGLPDCQMCVEINDSQWWRCPTCGCGSQDTCAKCGVA